MSKHAWMPFYVADFLGDTLHLTTEEVGAYLLLIAHYWQHGPLPDDDAVLRQITRIDARRWPSKSAKLKNLFVPRAGTLFHRRIDAELRKSDQRSETAKNSAKARWEAPKNDANALLAREHSDRNALAMLSQPQPQSSANTNVSATDSREDLAGNGRADDLAYRLADMAGITLGARNAAQTVAQVQHWLDLGVSPEACVRVVGQCLANGQSGPTRSLARFDAVIRTHHARAGGASHQQPRPPPRHQGAGPPPPEEQLRLFEEAARRMQAIGNVEAQVGFLAQAEALKAKLNGGRG